MYAKINSKEGKSEKTTLNIPDDPPIKSSAAFVSPFASTTISSPSVSSPSFASFYGGRGNKLLKRTIALFILFFIGVLTYIISVDVRLSRLLKVHDEEQLALLKAGLNGGSILSNSKNFQQPSSAAVIPQKKLKIAVGMISIFKADRTVYIYPTMQSIFEALFSHNNQQLDVDMVNVFVGNHDVGYLDFFKYSSQIKVHPIDQADFARVENDPLNHRAAYNYARAIKYLYQNYPDADGVLVMEDDVIMHPNASMLISATLSQAIQSSKSIGSNSSSNFILDGYVATFQTRSPEGFPAQTDIEPVTGVGSRCCTQSFLLSPTAAGHAYEGIERTVNGTDFFNPYDLAMTSYLFNNFNDFKFYQVVRGWVQHIGKTSTGLGFWHQGRSEMSFDTKEWKT